MAPHDLTHRRAAKGSSRPQQQQHWQQPPSPPTASSASFRPGSPDFFASLTFAEEETDRNNSLRSACTSPLPTDNTEAFSQSPHTKLANPFSSLTPQNLLRRSHRCSTPEQHFPTAAPTLASFTPTTPGAIAALARDMTSIALGPSSSEPPAPLSSERYPIATPAPDKAPLFSPSHPEQSFWVAPADRASSTRMMLRVCDHPSCPIRNVHCAGLWVAEELYFPPPCGGEVVGWEMREIWKRAEVGEASAEDWDVLYRYNGSRPALRCVA